MKDLMDYKFAEREKKCSPGFGLFGPAWHMKNTPPVAFLEAFSL